MVKLELGLGSRLKSGTFLFVRLFCLYSKGVPCYDDPTPKSILLRQIELHGILKRKGHVFGWTDEIKVIWEDLGEEIGSKCIL